jgi:hypothetical protein
MPLHDWIDRYPGVKRLLERPEDVLEGLSVQEPTSVHTSASRRPPHVYTAAYCVGERIHAGEKVSFDGEHIIRWSPGYRALGIALHDAEPGETLRIQGDGRPDGH